VGALDIAILVLLVIGLVVGFFKGLIRQILGFAGVVAGGFAAYYVYGWGHRSLTHLLGINLPAWLAGLIPAVFVFLVIILVFGILGRVLKNAVKQSNLGTVDRIAGAVIGVIKSAALILLLLMVLIVAPIRANFVERSHTGPIFGAFWNIADTLVVRLLGASENRIHKQLVSFGFDSEVCDRILRDPHLIRELTGTPGFFRRSNSNPKQTALAQGGDKLSGNRERILKVIDDPKLSPRQKADHILKIIQLIPL
jgi:membrane protein required for colicin V production